jgi:hypothetical protein
MVIADQTHLLLSEKSPSSADENGFRVFPRIYKNQTKRGPGPQMGVRVNG